MLDFAQLPPEINSALMYSGAGSGPMLSAAAAYSELSAELHSAASAFASAVASLAAGPWRGPAAAAMFSAVAPQVAWLRDAAGHAQQVTAQAMTAVGAYESAFAETVPPPVVAANRALLAQLVATNFLGQNVAAIAATEAQYGEMWAQDAAAMYGYAGTSAVATRLPPFAPTAPATTPGSVAAQAAAVANAAGAAQSGGVQALDAVPQTLASLAGAPTNNLASAAPTFSLGGLGMNAEGDGIVVGGILGDLLEGLTGSQTLDASTPFDAFIRLVSPTRLFATAFKDFQGIAQSLMPAAKSASESAVKAAEAALPAVANAGLGPIGSIGGTIGKAASIGGMSVPAGWASAAPAAAPVTLAVNGFGMTGAAEPATHAVGGVPMTSLGGAGRGAAAHLVAPRYGFKPTVIAQPPAGG